MADKEGTAMRKFIAIVLLVLAAALVVFTPGCITANEESRRRVEWTVDVGDELNRKYVIPSSEKDRAYADAGDEDHGTDLENAFHTARDDRLLIRTEITTDRGNRIEADVEASKDRAAVKASGKAWHDVTMSAQTAIRMMVIGGLAQAASNAAENRRLRRDLEDSKDREDKLKKALEEHAEAYLTTLSYKIGGGLGGLLLLVTLWTKFFGSKGKTA